MVERIVSGGQTGADRAALDLALEEGIPCGGWVPKGRRAEDGPLPDRYPVDELKSPSYIARTMQNVIDSDATVVFSHGRLAGGSLRTLEAAARYGKPLLHIDFLMRSPQEAAAVLNRWISEMSVSVLNVAGTRASRDPLIYTKTHQTLALTLLKR